MILCAGVVQIKFKPYNLSKTAAKQVEHRLMLSLRCTLISNRVAAFHKNHSAIIRVHRSSLAGASCSLGSIFGSIVGGHEDPMSIGADDMRVCEEDEEQR